MAVLFVAVGVGLTGLTATERTPTARSQLLPLGACGVVLAATPVSYVLAMAPAGRWVTTAILAAVVAVGALLLARRGVDAAAVRRTAGSAAAPVAAGGLVGLAALLPVMAQGFPTTLAYGNFDGWYFAARGDWLTRHPWGTTLTEQTADPLSTVAVWSDRFHLPQGVDTTVAYVQSMLGMDGYQVLGVLGAAAIMVGLCGWLTLRDAIDPAHRTAGIGWMAAAGVVSPVFVVMHGENFFAQLWGAALWPFVMATLIRLTARPSWRTVALAALATAAAVSFYPANLPWILVGAAGAVGVGVTLRVRDDGVGPRRAITAGALATVATIGAVIALAPLQVVRLVEFTRFAQGIGSVAAAAVPLEGRPATAVLAGTQTNLGRVVEDWRLVLAVALLVAIAFLIALPPRGGRLSSVLPPGVAVALITAVVFLRAQGRGETYMMNKSLMTGGALLAGLAFVAVALAPRSRLPRTAAAVGIAMLVIWGGMSTQLIRRTTDGWAGFRAEDRALGNRMASLGPDDALLVEGASEIVPTSFQYRMVTAYFASTATDGPVEGLGSTDSYLTAPTLVPKADARWRPSRAWRTVVTMGAEGPVRGRRLEWRNDAYAMWRAPTLDVTPFGTGWLEPLAGGTTPVSAAIGPVEFVVANADARERTATLAVRLRSRLATRTVTVTGGTAPATVTIPVNATRTVRVPVRVPPGGVAVLSMSDAPATPQAGLRVLEMSVAG